ncbi:MAG: c-type cytochrome [Caulobacterales bacterium]|nr:c-type cytochrome [Caulobacterales bacterium]
MKRLFAVAAVAAALSPALAMAQAMPAGDATKGAATFKMRCGVCHNTTGTDTPMAPTLKGIVGAKGGAHSASFKYSDALKKAAPVWTPDKINTWITAPQKMVPGTKMMMVVPNPQDRADIVAFLQTQK